MTTPPAPVVLPALPTWPTANYAIINAHAWAVLGETLEQLHTEHGDVLKQIAALSAEMQTLSSVFSRPVSGRVLVTLKEVRPVPIPVHPTDTLAFSVQYANAAHAAVAGTVPTTWTTVAPDGTTPVAVTLNVAAFPGDESGTTTPPLPEGSFIFHAQLTGASFEAVSDEVDVSPDNTPTSGMVTITATPAAP